MKFNPVQHRICLFKINLVVYLEVYLNIIQYSTGEVYLKLGDYQTKRRNKSTDQCLEEKEGEGAKIEELESGDGQQAG